MPDEPAEAQREPTETTSDRTITGYGIASAVLGVLSVAAVVLGFMIWSGHRSDAEERTYQTEVLQAAVDWTNVLVNMNAGTIDESLRTLHEGTVGQLNADFDTTVEPFRQLVAKLQSQTTGQVESVSIESLHHDLPGQKPAGPQPELSTVASRTDTVIVVATSVSTNAGNAAPKPIRWNLRLGVSDVNGKLLVSKLEALR
ncbi:hypothetical protein [Mycolicibacterium sediminis]|uniref:Mammalian cell entry protein n=1 Tax=Mycolicibacterium sediminis TaxID=1286180 RepID=A0A7I7QNK9_9MYCO|nr:hypothetical protein [Mycolicibacterium sediminis]BBY27396.1 hypothetical protein MSEDJ_14920 [Mycolicibacterium sediminis]